MKYLHQALGLLLAVQLGVLPRRRRDDRGLSQSTENAILLGGAVAIAVLVVTVVTSYVAGKLPR